MNNDKELMQMALDALEHGLPIIEDFGGKEQLQLQHKAIAVLYEALRARLAQPEPEPVAWGITNTRPTEKEPLMMVMLDKPEPSHLVVPLYTAPPQREWVGLTKEELQEISDFHFHGAFSARDIYEDIETRLKDKNT